jgi:hypothetical protein
MSDHNQLKAALAGLPLRTLAAASLLLSHSAVAQWWDPGEDRPIPAYVEYANDLGRVGLVNASGEITTDGHPFFEALGTNGRACVSCHQPADGMSLSLKSIRERWEVTQGKDPIFAMVDGANCPNLASAEPESHSLLLERGLFRVALPWPPVGVEPEFSIEVVRDPTGCNTGEEFGINGENGQISVYRRPRPAVNLRYVASSGFGVSPFIGKTGALATLDEDTGLPVNMNMMADARKVTLKSQAQAAAHDHMQVAAPLTEEQLEAIKAFELQLFGAQAWSAVGGALVEEGVPSGIGPQAMANGRDGVLGNNTSAYVFPLENKWADLPEGMTAEDQARNAFLETVQRGHDVFFFRTFWISDAMHINTVGLGNPLKRTCATCHGMHMTGMDTANGWMDLGTTNQPWRWSRRKAPGRQNRRHCPWSRSPVAKTCRRILSSAARSTRRTPAAR